MSRYSILITLIIVFQVLKQSNLWTKFESGDRPFDRAVILCDSAYGCRDWLIPPYPGDPQGAQKDFNKAHIKTRNTVERCFGVVKHRFYALKTGIRFHSIEEASKLIICGFILHNMCISAGDDGNDLDGEDDDQDLENEVPDLHTQDLNGSEKRRQQLLNFFVK